MRGSLRGCFWTRFKIRLSCIPFPFRVAWMLCSTHCRGFRNGMRSVIRDGSPPMLASGPGSPVRLQPPAPLETAPVRSGAASDGPPRQRSGAPPSHLQPVDQGPAFRLARKGLPHGRSRQSSEGPQRSAGPAKRVDGRDRPCVVNALRAQRGPYPGLISSPADRPQPTHTSFRRTSILPTGLRKTLNTVHPRSAPFGDLNGDGHLDMFIAAHGRDVDPYPGEQNRLYLSRSGGGWRDASEELPQLADFSHSVALGDLSGRGLIDIIVGNGYPGENGILPYALLNSGGGSFVLNRDILPVGHGETMDFRTGHNFPGTELTDLDGDGLPELIVTADRSSTYGNPESTVFWNRLGAFSEQDKTVLPTPAPFVDTHIVLEAASFDADGDDSLDLVVVGTQGNPFYDGWFVQLLMNQGDRTFVDETPGRLQHDEWYGGTVGEEAGAPWPMAIEVLDFNGDGVLDFAVTSIRGGLGYLPQDLPVIWLNDGSGRFAALKVHDFVLPEDEWRIFGAQLIKTLHGYSFIVPQSYPGSGGLILTGLLAARPLPTLPPQGQ